VTGGAAVTAVPACGATAVWLVEPRHSVRAMSSIVSAARSVATGELVPTSQRLRRLLLFITAMLAMSPRSPMAGAGARAGPYGRQLSPEESDDPEDCEDPVDSGEPEPRLTSHQDPPPSTRRATTITATRAAPEDMPFVDQTARAAVGRPSSATSRPVPAFTSTYTSDETVPFTRQDGPGTSGGR
jgi:hypothetical protein